jgi:hypothetical protein
MFQLQLFFCSIAFTPQTAKYGIDNPNSEAGNDEIQNVQRWIFISWELHSKILVGDKNLL